MKGASNANVGVGHGSGLFASGSLVAEASENGIDKLLVFLEVNHAAVFSDHKEGLLSQWRVHLGAHAL